MEPGCKAITLPALLSPQLKSNFSLAPKLSPGLSQGQDMSPKPPNLLLLCKKPDPHKGERLRCADI